MVTLNLILTFTKILDLIRFPMLQTRPLYLVYEQSYIQNRLSQSKSVVEAGTGSVSVAVSVAVAVAVAVA